MSLRLRLLNAWLKAFEKRFLTRETDPARLRQAFERKAALFFRAPLGSTIREDRLGGVPVRVVCGPGVTEATARGRILYFHGGAYVFGSARTHQGMLARLSALTGLPAILPDYRLAPEHPFPAAIDDALAVWRACVADGVKPTDIVLGGDSAGGGLALALLGELCRCGEPGPGAVFALSPFTDQGAQGGSRDGNARAEAVLPVSRFAELREMVLAGADPADPRASPVHAGFGGASPVWIAVGTTEVLYDDAVRVAERLRAAQVPVDLRIFEDHPHVWPLFFRWLPEARETLSELAGWIRSVSRRSADS